MYLCVTEGAEESDAIGVVGVGIGADARGECHCRRQQQKQDIEFK